MTKIRQRYKELVARKQHQVSQELATAKLAGLAWQGFEEWCGAQQMPTNANSGIQK